MSTSIEIPINYTLISIFIGYMYHYLQSNDYGDVISLKTVKIGIISGGLISVTLIIISLLSANSLNIPSFLTSLIIVVFGMIVSIISVVIGGISGIAVKRIISNRRRNY